MTEKAASRIEQMTARVITRIRARGFQCAIAGDAALARAKEILHGCADSVTAVVATPGGGRAVLMHDNGTESRISSPDLPFRLAVPGTFGMRGKRPLRAGG